MENKLQSFNFDDKGVRTINNDDVIWFAMPDVASVLGLSNPTVSVKSLDDDERAKFNLGRQGLTNFISEPGLYKLIGASRKPEAKRFNRWVTHEVLPSLRKHGAYATPQTIESIIENPDFGIKLLQSLKSEQDKNKKLESQNKAMKPKALFADAVETSNTSILVGQLAKLLKQNGVDIGQNKLFKYLRDNHYLGQRGEYYNMPTQYSMEMGLFEIKERTIQNPDGSVKTVRTTKVTGKGQTYFVNKFLK